MTELDNYIKCLEKYERCIDKCLEIYKKRPEKVVYKKAENKVEKTYKSKKRSKFFKVATSLAVAVCLSTLGGISTYAIVNYANERKEAYKYEYIYNVMHKAPNGKVIKLPIADDLPIGIVLNGFSNEEKAVAKEAIKELDDISENINYVFMPPEQAENYQQKIYVNNNVDLSEYNDRHSNTMGITIYEYTYTNYEANIEYPISINLKEGINSKTKKSTSLLKYVLQHEMMHTLGFLDIYNSTQKNKTIMYHACNVGKTTSYSTRDKEFIKLVYDEKINVTNPEKVTYSVDYQSQDLYNDKNYEMVV